MADDIVTMSSGVSQEGNPTGTIRWEIGNISGLGVDYRHSPEIEVRGTKWNLTVMKCEEVRLGVFLSFVKDDLIMRTIDVSAQFTLFHKYFRKNIYRKFDHTFDHSIHDYGFSKFVSWTNIIDKEKGFVNDSGKIIIEVQFTLSRIQEKIIPHLDFAEREIVLVIDGKKIYVSKEVLSIHSPVFKAMFYGDFAEKQMNEIELKDVDYEDFIELLNILYSTGKIITDAKAARLLALGDRYQISSIVDEAEQVLISSTKFTIAGKLKLAGDYRLEQLQESCLDVFTTIEDLAHLENTNEFKDFSDTVKVALQKKLEKLNEDSRSPSTEADD